MNKQRSNIDACLWFAIWCLCTIWAACVACSAPCIWIQALIGPLRTAFEMLSKVKASNTEQQQQQQGQEASAAATAAKAAECAELQQQLLQLESRVRRVLGADGSV